MQNPLTIYKASAGSGKTYQLTAEYLKIILAQGGDFKKILAVTFTNKATAEMRERILNELAIIANNQQSQHQKNLCSVLNIDSTELTNRAKNRLNLILHNYGQFKISTIDSFFQKIIKSFTREVGINVGFNLELDDSKVIDSVIAGFIDTIETDNDLYIWLADYLSKKITNNKSWDIQTDLEGFAKECFTDAFFSLNDTEIETLANTATFSTYKKKLDNYINTQYNYVKQIGLNAKKQLEQLGISEREFTYKATGPAGFITKLGTIAYDNMPEMGTRAITALNTTNMVDGWLPKNNNNATLTNVVENILLPALVQYNSWLQTELAKYNTTVAIIKNIATFALIIKIYKAILEYCNLNNIFLLKLANPLLSKMIGDNDAPFIYEKTGEYLSNFMIDEFQDTSVLQWDNFLPLLSNSISQNQYSLVVGDVKQSIYRWRGSNWELLASQIKQTFKSFGVTEKNLEYNWRSSANVINFNNNFFNIAASHLSSNFFDNPDFAQVPQYFKDTVAGIYNGAEQKIPEHRPANSGYAEIRFFDKPDSIEPDDDNQPDDDETTDSPVLLYVSETILKLANMGYKPGDIAILVRKNKQGAQVAKHLMQCQKNNPDKAHLFRFISGDSVTLTASTAVNLIIASLQYLIEPDNKLLQVQIAYLTSLIIDGQAVALQQLQPADADNNTPQNPIPGQFASSAPLLLTLPLYDMVQQIIALLIFNNGAPKEAIATEQPFLEAFADVVTKYQKSHNTDVRQFLEWWGQNADKLYISMPENLSAIRIMTVHKSKGLEFNAVIVPFTNKQAGPKQKLLWCKPNDDFFGTMPIVPVNVSKRLLNSYFAAQYCSEKVMGYIDDLNLLYVAFTRAKHALFVSSIYQKSVLNNNSTTDYLLYQFACNNNSNNSLPVYTLGNLTQFNSHVSHDTQNFDISYSQCLPTLNRLKIKLHAPDFFMSNNNDNKNNSNRGTIIHKILEQVITITDLQPAIKSMVNSGLITSQQANEIELLLNQAFKNEQVTGWFDKSWKVKTEASIMMPDGEIKRPDRVIINNNSIIVIDYKTTARLSNEHIKQVAEYVNLVSEIEHKPAKGYVWYILNNKIVEAC